MLQIFDIEKEYRTGELVQKALNGVSVNFRENEFVSILGPSGSGKTTLLNIIGGLDSYDKGDLVIEGISTKNYKDRDWDTYRNHTIGFVFQSYNLIPHQTLLSNVELALTIAGISKAERKARAKEALEKVGLGEHVHKRPNQLSGGQMQRVAIARALVNNPHILLADEPTGALDSETSVQIMELLKEVANERLVVMVTHNPELAEEYSSRIIKVRDGKIVGDSNPFVPVKTSGAQTRKEKPNKAKMSMKTSLSLSFNNLKTKKKRTFLTSFAGSIGIIGIALILSLSNGVNTYITNLQRDTMTAYPVSVTSETMNMENIMGAMETEGKEDQDDAVYSSVAQLTATQNMTVENNLTEFKKYVDDPNGELQNHVGDTGVVYSYNVNFNVFSYDKDGKVVNSNADASELLGGSAVTQVNPFESMMSSSGNSQGASNFSEMAKGKDDVVGDIVKDNYEVVYGKWPTSYDEVILVLDSNNEVSVEVLYQLGLMSADEYKEVAQKVDADEEIEPTKLDYEEIINHEFKMVLASDRYKKNADGTFTYVEDSEYTSTASLLDDATTLKVVGIVSANEGATVTPLSTHIGYTSLLTDYVIEQTDASEVVQAQVANPEVNIMTNTKFTAADDAQKVVDTKAYLLGLGVSEKANFYAMMMYSSGATAGAGAMAMDEVSMAAMLDQWVNTQADDATLISYYDENLSGNTYDENMLMFGKVSYDSPTSINIYADTFEDKDAITALIEEYNEEVSEENQITYTDMVAMMTSSITTMIDVVSYVLIAFVGVSLIVSSIMIGIITHISVMERTKEIGVLRALGASKKNISQVFNAETLIIGLCSGILGVGVTMLLNIPITAVLQNILQNDTLVVGIPVISAVVLILISVGITVLAGLSPAKAAAKKDPVLALRTE